ncbi:MAG: hypothetical protein WB615_02570 [Candidatus Tumulicola sp.]
MFRLICLVLTLAMVGCAQRVTPFAPTGSQSTIPNARAITARPADSVTAYVKIKNSTLRFAKFTVYWSYAANPIWHVEASRCLRSGDEWDTQVIYNHIKGGPQIRFEAAVEVADARTCFLPAEVRTVTFRGMLFEPNAHFHARLKQFFTPTSDYFTLCAHGGGNKEECR